jgi:hypothetical protein
MCGEVSEQPGMPREGSALRANQQNKGQNSYYYAHTRAYEVPADAKVVEGPGLITGGPPVKLESVDAAVAVSTVVQPIRNYAWSEDDAAVKVSVDGDDGAVATEENTTCDFQADSVVCTVKLGNKELQLKIALKKSVDPEKCKLRISKGKGIRLTLTKAEKGKWYDLCKSGTK